MNNGSCKCFSVRQGSLACTLRVRSIDISLKMKIGMCNNLLTVEQILPEDKEHSSVFQLRRINVSVNNNSVPRRIYKRVSILLFILEIQNEQRL